MGIIMHENVAYGGGSSIEPNPQESATEQLETLGIDGDVYEVTDANAIHTSDVGVANGVAELDANGFVPSSQLPSYVDDVLEYASRSAFPATGETGKIYVALDTNLTYRWGGSDYVEISPSLALGETSSTAYRGDRGKIAYDHSQSDHSGIKPAFTEASTRANIASGESFATLLGKIKKFFSDLKTVAFTGAYSDLSGTPTIPTVNNGTLTIQKNGTQVATFSANQSGNATANIECATPSDVEGSKVATGNPLTVTDAAGIKAEKIVIEFEPKQAGSGTPSPSNIRPITGYTSLSADRCGKNKLLPFVYGVGLNATNGSESSSDISMTTDYVPVDFITNPNYYLSGLIGTVSSFVAAYNANHQFLGRTSGSVRSEIGFASNSFTGGTPQGTGNIAFLRVTQYNSVTAQNAQTVKAQLEIGSQPTPFEPYARKITIQLGQTLYGGKLTILQDGSADIDVDTGYKEYDGSSDEDWHFENAAAGKNFWIPEPTFKKPCYGNDLICNMASSTSSAGTERDKVFVSNGGNLNVTFGDTLNINTASDFKTWLASHVLQVAGTIATPFTLHLSPVETLTLLQGINNVWTDGTTLSLTYQPDNAIGQAKGTAQAAMMSTIWTSLGVFSHGATPTIPQCKELLLSAVSADGTEYYGGEVFPYALYGSKFLVARPIDANYVCELKPDGSVIAGGTYKLAIFYR